MRCSKSDNLLKIGIYGTVNAPIQIHNATCSIFMVAEITFYDDMTIKKDGILFSHQICFIKQDADVFR
jgi:hypothetical protein